MSAETLLAPFGLTILGTAPAEGGSVALIGPKGGAMWPRFQSSAEAGDGGPNPLDRWSARVIGGVADALGCQAVFPFEGPPWPPFVTWALATGRIFQSPVGLLVHDREGLFVSFRGALLLPSLPPDPAIETPCAPCPQPCRTACPVGALTAEGYDVTACRAHVASPAGVACRQGCLVRRACPVGQGLRPAAQSAFHMRAFLGSPP